MTIDNKQELLSHAQNAKAAVQLLRDELKRLVVGGYAYANLRAAIDVIDLSIITIECLSMELPDE